MAAECYQYKLDQRGFDPKWYDDPALTYVIEKTVIPDASFGVYAYGKKYYAGLSASNLFQSKMKVNQHVKENKMVRHYFLYGGYRFVFEKSKKTDFALEPSVLLKMTETPLLQVDVNLKFIIKNDYWFSFSVRPKDSFIASVGVKYKNYYFGYAYDITFSELSSYTWGSQEFIFGVNIGENNRKHRSFF
ncbi:MAG: PorP/SprF family type IX secretion system membrane protein [Bacteroidales bacterium]|nr:PorP/SprF family type IX secretion system membrane protein [Bacteroidales bacterium]